jgi:hypothetical protein
MSRTKWMWFTAVMAALMIIHIATANVVGLLVGAPGLMIGIYFCVKDNDDDYPDCLGI